VAQNTIKLAFYGIPGVELEGIVSGTSVTPGQLVELQPDGTYALASVADGFTTKTVAVENPYGAPPTPNGIKDIEFPYTAGNKLYMIQARPGDVMYMLLAASLACAVGEPLASNGDGNLLVSSWAAVDAGGIVGSCLEAVTLAAFVQRIKVEMV
jgi:hypothetical protein